MENANEKVMLSEMENVQIPSCCGFKDGCEVGWHMDLYALDPTDATPITGDLDGNWDPIDSDDVPTWGEYEAAWKDYHQYVARTGLDPLGEFLVPRTKPAVKVGWQFVVQNSILGPKLVQARRGGRGSWVQPAELPRYVQDWFALRQPVLPGAAVIAPDEDPKFDMAKLLAVETDLRWQVKGVKGVATIEEKGVPRPAAVVARELRAAARKALRAKRSS